MKDVGNDLARLFASLEGLELSSVEFVRDYVQLRFDGPVLNVIDRLDVGSGASALSRGDDGYYDRLIALIGRTVAQARLRLKEDASLVFDDGTVLKMLLGRRRESIVLRLEEGVLFAA